MSNKYNAFISYSHSADRKLAEALRTGIRRFALPWYKRSKLDVFIDEANLSVSPQLWNNIEQALSQSDYLLYLASTTSAQSKWVAKELNYWIDHKSIDRLIILLTDGELVWDDAQKSFQPDPNLAVSPALNTAFTQEPFYIDLREYKSEDELSLKNPLFNKEILKITAELYGVSQEQMAGDEVKAKRKVRRLTATVIAVLLLAFATTLFFYDRSESNRILAQDNAEKASNLLQIALQGRGERYDNKPIDSIIALLEYERIRPIRELITPKVLREPVGTNNNYDYLIWIDLPSFRLNEIDRVEYEWPSDGYQFARNAVVSKESSTGFAFGYRGINAIKNEIYLRIYFKDNSWDDKTFLIRDALGDNYQEYIPLK
ncbi:TIR domain-containing protein [Croceiramulus getboli]|nr:toll/interleukin-1 receptor domain-containing protein [Flavobacteriaceae bacterium YJPT1-3]